MPTNQYKLSIRLQSDGFSLCIYNQENSLLSTKQAKIDWENKHEEEIKAALNPMRELDIEFYQLKLTTESKFYSLVPDAFADPELSDALMKFQYPDFEATTHSIHTIVVPAYAANLLIACPIKIENVVRNVFGNAEVSHPIVEFLNRINTKQGLHIALHSSKIDIAVVVENKLILLNTYAYSSNEDILYHLLNIMYTLKLQPNVRQLTLYSAQQQTTLEKLLLKHIPNTTFIQSTI